MTSPAPEHVLGDWHETTLRVRYSETDKMGIVYYANYLIWFEIGRTEYCRARGFSYRDMETKDDAFLVVAESYCRYKAPAYYDDDILIRTRITELRKRSLRFGYEIVRANDSQVISEGETGHVVTDGSGRVRSFPEGYAKRLLAPPILKSQTGELVPSQTAPSNVHIRRCVTRSTNRHVPTCVTRCSFSFSHSE